MNIVLVDDHGIFRNSLSFLISHKSNHRVLLECGSISELREQWQAHSPDLIIMDYHMPGGNALSCAEYIKRRDPDIKIIFLTGTQSGVVLKYICQSPADAVIHKEEGADDILNAIELALRGEKSISKAVQTRISGIDFDLTQREFEVLCLLMKGLSSTDMAGQMNIAPRTIDKHKENIMKKASVSNVVQLVELGHKMKLLEID